MKYQIKEVEVRMCLKEKGSLYSEKPLSTQKDVVQLMQKEFYDLDREVVFAINMDNKLHPINFNVVSVGGINSSIFSTQNVFKSALLSNASGLIIIHNHPSGDTTPSREDIHATNKLVEAGKLLGIKVFDHIIIGNSSNKNHYFSFLEELHDLMA